MASPTRPPTTTTSATERRQRPEEASTVVLGPGRGGRGGRLGLGLQIFIVAALLLATTVAITVAVAAVRAGAVAERSIREALRQVPVVFAGWTSARAAAAQQQLEPLAAGPGTAALFAEGVDAATRWEFAAADAPAVLRGAGTVFLFDRRGRLLARSDRPEGDGVGTPFAGVDWVARPLRTGAGTTAFVRERTALALVSAVPVFSGAGEGARLEGVLAATFPLGPEAIAELQAITRGEVGVVVDMGEPGVALELEPSVTTPGLQPPGLAVGLLGPSGAAAVFDAGEVFGPASVRAPGGMRLVLAVPVRNTREQVLGAVLVSRSRSEEMAAFEEIRRGLVVVGALVLLAALPVSFLLGRRVARPLRQLAAGAEAVREGRLDVELPAAAGGEVGVLARAFRGMVRELREKQALERYLAALRREEEEGEVRHATLTPAAGDERVPLPGEVFAGRWALRAVIGRGGMATVLRARDLELDEDVALKVLNPGIFPDSERAVATLRQEVRLARRITHPNVVRVHDLVEADGLRCLTMELVPGTTLRQLVARHGALELAPGLQVAKQLCRGLAAVHERGIVHRDVKPQNVMVLPNGQVKLMDFGVSWAAGGAVADGITVGTPLYMSPEQCRGEEVDRRADIYSLGVLLYETFAGVPPFPERDVATLVHHHLTVPAPPLGQRRAEVPVQLEEVVAWCLAKRREDRPPHIAAVYGALRDL